MRRMMRSKRQIYLLLPLLGTLIACQEKNQKKIKAIGTSPNAEIEGGLGIEHTLIFSSKLEPKDGQIYFSGVSEGISLSILQQEGIKVIESLCNWESCSLKYEQSNRTEGKKPSIVYQFIRNDGKVYNPGTLSVRGEIPTTAKEIEFVPKWEELVTIKIPVSNQEGQRLGSKPELVNLEPIGGEIKGSRCESDFCEIDFRLTTYSEFPLIRFQIQNSISLSPKSTAKAQSETFSYTDSELHYYKGSSSILLRQGTEFQSSWNRPVNAISVVSQKGFTNQLYFTCSQGNCIARYSNWDESKQFSLEYQIINDKLKGKGKVNFSKTEPKLTPFAKTIQLHSETYIKIPIIQGKDYTSENNIRATGMKLKSVAGQNDYVQLNPTCSEYSDCEFLLNVTGTKEFYLYEYSLLVGDYESPKEIIKIIPAVVETDSKLAVWDDGSKSLPLEIKPSVDYKVHDGSIPTEMSIESTSISFEGVDTINNENRNKILKCDAEGICRATISKPYYINNGTIIISFKTPTTQSQKLTKTIEFKRDAIVFKETFPTLVVVGKKIDENIEEFELRLSREDYLSQFKAEFLEISEISSSGIDIEQQKTFPCDDQGNCTLSGRFTPSTKDPQLKIILQNKYGFSSKKSVQLIAQESSNLILRLDSYLIPLEKQEAFNVSIKKDRDYTGKELAKFIKVLAPKGNFVDAPEATEATFACDEKGNCQFKLQPRFFSQTLEVKLVLVGSDGKQSLSKNIKITLPPTLLLNKSISTPSGFTEFSINFNSPPGFANDTNLKVNFLGNDLMEAISLPWNRYSPKNLPIKLIKALEANQEAKFKIQLTSDQKVSNIAELTFSAQPSLTLKSNLKLQAIPIEGTSNQYQLELKYFDHFERFDNGDLTFVEYIFFDSSLFELIYENRDILQPEAQKCDYDDNLLRCKYTFVRANANGPLTLDVKLKGGIGTRLEQGESVQSRSFQIEFP